MRPFKLLLATALANVLGVSAAQAGTGINGISFAPMGTPCSWGSPLDHQLTGSATQEPSGWRIDFDVYASDPNSTAAADPNRHLFVLGFSPGGYVFPPRPAGCTIYPSLDLLQILPGTGGPIVRSLTVPDDSALIGLVVTAQVAHLDPPLVPTAVSNGLDVEFY